MVVVMVFEVVDASFQRRAGVVCCFRIWFKRGWDGRWWRASERAWAWVDEADMNGWNVEGVDR